MSDDRASRLRERRRSSKARAQGSETAESEPAEDASTETPPESTTGDEPDSEPDSEVVSSVKEEQVGTYMYLPESQKRELKRVFNVLKAQYEYEYDEEFEKNRHFYPLLVQFGIETLDGAPAAEVRDLLGDLRRD